MMESSCDALGDAVDLDEEQDGDVVALELAGLSDGFGGSPGVAVEDYAGGLACGI